MTAHLEAGFTSGAKVGGRTARLTRCRDCTGVILTGLDGDTCAWQARADLTPITTQRDRTLPDDYPTYDVIRADGRLRLERRSRFTRAAASHRGLVILPAHCCPGTVPDFTWLPTPPDADERCPF